MRNDSKLELKQLQKTISKKLLTVNRDDVILMKSLLRGEKKIRKQKVVDNNITKCYDIKVVSNNKLIFEN